MNERTIRPVAYIHTDFKEKFGIPRQASLVPELTGRIVFEGRFKDPAAIMGLEEYSHLWLLWGFSENVKDGDTPLTVCPPRLGGKIKKGVFATRSPFRPNFMGLSCVKLEKIITDEINGPQLIVSGIDMLDGSPIYDIKPYIPYSDSMEYAEGSFGQAKKDSKIEVEFPEELLLRLPEDKRTACLHLLEQDPRAAYNKEPGYVFGLNFAGFDIRFKAEHNNRAGSENDRLVVCDVLKADDNLEKIK